MSAELKSTLYSEQWPEGFTMNHSVGGQLWDIYELLRNGRNTKVTIHKDDGSRVEYEIAPEGS